MTTILAGGLSGAVWILAASNGYAVEMAWLPAVALGAAWSRREPFSEVSGVSESDNKRSTMSRASLHRRGQRCENFTRRSRSSGGLNVSLERALCGDLVAAIPPPHSSAAAIQPDEPAPLRGMEEAPS